MTDDALNARLRRSLARIKADAALCSARDEAALARERPVFARLLNPSEPMWPGTRTSNGVNVRRRWPNRNGGGVTQ